MAKEKFNISNLGLPAKPAVVRTETPPLAEKIAEKAVETIHAAPPEPPKKRAGRPPKAATEPTAKAPAKPKAAEKAAPPKSEKAAAKAPAPKPETRAPKFPQSRFAALPVATDASGELRKISLDLPVEWFKAIKFHCVEHDITMREFLMDVIERDLKKR